jgi:hypothetical protein
MIAAVLWLAFAGAIILGLFAIRVTDRNVSWIAGIVATALLVGFSWLAGFTIGPFTIALPVLLTATVTSRGAPLLVRMLVIALAAGVYWLVTWPLLQFANWTLVLPALCAVAYVVAIRRSASARS